MEWGLGKKVAEWEVKNGMKMEEEAKGKLEGQISKEFEVKVGVHQGSILIPLLFKIILNEVERRTWRRCMRRM